MTTIPTSTAIVTTKTTSVQIEPNDAPTHQPPSTPYSFTAPSTFPLLLLLISILIVDHFTHRRHLQTFTRQQEERDLAKTWQEPWLTKDWPTLYGLIALAHENKIEPQHTPFRTSCISAILARSKKSQQRWALPRLLEHGIMPLHINDGGVSTTRTRTWGLMSTFPYVTVPLYQQAKSRAYFVFLIPHPEQAQVMRLIDILGANRMGYAVSTTTRTPNHAAHGSQNSTVRNLRKRLESGSDEYPDAVGAQCACEAILPFLPDAQIPREQGTRVEGLDSYLKIGLDADADGGQHGRLQQDLGMARVPLLHYSSWAVVRLEAPHWGYVELDSFVLGAVEESGMVDRWKRGICEERAVDKLARCGLEV